MTQKVFKNSIYYMLASFLPITVGFLMLPIYSSYLTPTDYGIVALVLSLQPFLQLIMTLQVNNSIFRFYFDYYQEKESLKIFISTIILFVLFFSTIILFLILFNINEIVSFIFPKTIGYNEIFTLGLITSFFGIFNSIFTNIIRVQEKANLFMKISILIFGFSLFTNIVEVIILRKGAYGVLEATLISTSFSSFIYLFIVKEFFIFRFDFYKIIEPLKFSIPLIPHALSGLIFMYSDRIILERYVTLSAIGLYMFSDKIAMIFKIFVDEFNNAFIPYFNKNAQLSRNKAIEVTQKISLIFIYLTTMTIASISLFSVEFVYILFDDKYFDTWIMIPLLSSSYVFRSLYCFSINGVFYAKKTGKIALITIVAGTANIFLNLWLIPIYGIMIAIYTTIFSFFLTFLLAEAISYKIYYLYLDIKKIMILLSYLALTIVFSIWLNSNFFEFGYIEYMYKLFIIILGLIIGKVLGVLNINRLKKIRE